MADFDLTQTGQEVQNILDGAAMQTDLTAEVDRAELAEQTLQGNIDIEETRAKAAEKQNADDIDVIEGKIPAAASDENQLADKNFVNSSIATATATYRGAYNLVSDLSLTVDATHEQIATALAGEISTADNNDYCFVLIPTSSETPTQIASIERYKFNGSAWAYEYTLNNSGFTADQWAALNSGITNGLVAKLTALPTNSEIVLALAGKQDVLTIDNEPTENSNNPVKSGGVYDAIDVEATTRAAAIAAIVALIPEAASALNQLADKSFVNSSISTATAVFKGTFNVVVDLELSYNATQEQIALMLASKIIAADNNDYCFVLIPTSDETPLQIARTDRYKFNGSVWAYEYTLNNSGFTSVQWAAINSGITSLLKDKLIDLPTATELTALLAAKQNKLTFDTAPTTGSTNPVTSGGVKTAIDTEKARAEAAEADRYTKAETYSKNEIDGLVSTPHQEYVTVANYASLPASGSTDTIYRVSSYDGANSQVDNTVYSEYAWNGTQYIFLCVKSQIEEVFDITVYNNNTKYADLAAALGVDGANIPSSLRRGGMSVKFVQSSDNKYIQARCMAQNFTTDTTQWQGVDDTPTIGSDNLVKSGGVSKVNLLKAYFTANKTPSFYKHDDGSVDVVLKASTLRLYNVRNEQVLEVLIAEDITYNVGTTQSIVVDTTTNTISVVNTNVSSNYITLFSNAFNTFFGVLAPYYFANIANKRELFGYFQGGASPVIDILNDVVSITMPNKKLYIHNRDNIRVKEVAASVFDGETAGTRKYTLNINNLNSAELIYDFKTNTASVVAPTEIKEDCVILLGNTYGCLYGILAGYYYYNKVATKKPITVYFVGIKEPGVTTDGTNIYFTIPSSGFRLYLNDGTTRNVTSANGVKFTIPGLSKLVYDVDDSTVKVVANTTIGNYYELLVNAYGNVSGFFAPAYAFATNSILNLYKNQTEVQIIQGMKKGNTRYDVQGVEPLVLLHMSDLHENTDNLQRIMDYHKMYSSKIDDIINTGDNVNFNDGYSSVTAVDGFENILTTIGNHDVLNSPSTYADLPVYNLEIKDYVSNWGVTQPNDAAENGYCYYYKDYVDKKIRLIVLDNFTQNMTAQVSWLSNVLADARTNNLSVVCAIHFPCPMNLIKETTFCSLDGSGVFEDATQEVLLSAVDTFINNGGKFVCWLTGHTHQNLFGLVTGHTNQICVNIAASTNDRNSDSCERVAGTKSQDCFNLFSVDLNTKTIELHRLGVEYDRYLRHIGTMCYNYETKTLVYSN